MRAAVRAWQISTSGMFVISALAVLAKSVIFSTGGNDAVFSIDGVVGSTGAFCVFCVFLGTYILFGRALGWLTIDLG